MKCYWILRKSMQRNVAWLILVMVLSGSLLALLVTPN